MTIVALLRHGPTEWNKQKRMQGHADIPLLPDARTAFERLRVPSFLEGATWVTSPLTRARETAMALGLDARPESTLIETHWGDWEGQTLADLRAADPDGMRANEARGLLMQPPGGERPIDVQVRALAWLGSLEEGGTYGAVTHKGVIRAVLSAALQWDMRTDCPAKIDWAALQIFRIVEGFPMVEALNVPLEPR